MVCRCVSETLPSGRGLGERGSLAVKACCMCLKSVRRSQNPSAAFPLQGGPAQTHTSPESNHPPPIYLTGDFWFTCRSVLSRTRGQSTVRNYNMLASTSVIVWVWLEAPQDIPTSRIQTRMYNAWKKRKYQFHPPDFTFQLEGDLQHSILPWLLIKTTGIKRTCVNEMVLSLIFDLPACTRFNFIHVIEPRLCLGTICVSPSV